MLIREVQVTYRGLQSSDSVKTEILELNEEEFQIIGKGVQLLYLTKGDLTLVDLLLQAETKMTGLSACGYLNVAKAIYDDINDFIVLSVKKV